MIPKSSGAFWIPRVLSIFGWRTNLIRNTSLFMSIFYVCVFVHSFFWFNLGISSFCMQLFSWLVFACVHSLLFFDFSFCLHSNEFCINNFLINAICSVLLCDKNKWSEHFFLHHLCCCWHFSVSFFCFCFSFVHERSAGKYSSSSHVCIQKLRQDYPWCLLNTILLYGITFSIVDVNAFVYATAVSARQLLNTNCALPNKPQRNHQHEVNQ